MNDVYADHPGAAALTAFGLGHLAGREARSVEQHLAVCDACRSTVEDVPADAFLSLLRAAHRTAAPSDDSARPGTATEAGPEPAAAPGTTPPALADHPRYLVRELLGVGGMGAVYRAQHQLMERTVALKVINRSLTDNPAMVERFRREVKAAAKLAHPNIVHAYDADQAGDTHFLVMEYVDGTSLDRLVAEQGRLPVPQACDAIRQAALGLQHAHEQGMVHRDIKPQNLMRTPDGRVKILDFGLARFARETAPAGALLTSEAPAAAAGESLTQVGTVVGTPDYIAPEQIRDAHTADIRADLYSLGCTLYDLLAGQAPFPEGTVLQKVMAHLEQAPRPLSELRADVPAELAQVVERLMAKDPAQRYATPADVATALLPFTRPARPGRPEQRRRRLLAATAAGLLLAAGILAGALASRALLRPDGHPAVEPRATASREAGQKGQPPAAEGVGVLPNQRSETGNGLKNEPTAVLELLDQSALPRVKVKATAVATSASHPVTSLRLLVDGRPLPEGTASLNLKAAQERAEAEWDVTLPPGGHELRVLARTTDTAGTSQPLAVEVPPAGQGASTLHVLAVGINEFREKALRLRFAVPDARDVADAFGKHCAGAGNVFGTVRRKVLLDDKATRPAVLEGIRTIRQAAQPNDLVVVYYSGHGVQEKDDFYLLPVDADVTQLAGTALSGRELREQLAEIPCQVLLILDTCHSAAAGRAFAPSGTDAARKLSDAECAVAVLCSAMGEEQALEKDGHGLFTRALIDALTRSDVPCNRRDHQQYVNHLHTFVLEEVQAASGDKQHPLLVLPWVTRPFPIRRVPEQPQGER
jgi:hypothetical protein